jgi:outer membrane receptor protein involved in Fe transport
VARAPSIDGTPKEHPMPALKPLAVCIALCLSPVALAQGAAPANPQPADPKELEAVTVVGTNLRGVDLAEAQPVIVITADEIRKTGATNLGDLIRTVTATGGGTGNFNTDNSGTLQADSPAGMAGASLRGLGTASTLTLINGRRVAVASFANNSENFVDLNAIPMAAIERVEILAAGASAIYGADAVAGVVNVVLRQSFDGIRIAGSYGDSTRGTNEQRANVNLVAGFGNEDAGGVVVVDLFDRGGFYNRDRAITAVEPRPSQQGIFPSFNFGNFNRDDFVERACPDPIRFDGRPGFPLGSFGAYCELNRNQYTAADPALRQLGAYGTFRSRLADTLGFFAEAQFQKNASEANAAPAPWSEERIAFNHPNFPAELRQRMVAQGLGATQDIFGWGRFPDARTIEVDTRSFRLLAGLTGNLGDWSWEAALHGGRSESEQRATAGIYNVARFRAALRGQLCADGRTTCAPGAGGLYYNPFGGQAAQDPSVLALIREQVPRDGTSTMAGFDLKFNGELGELGGGAIASVFGLDLRREKVTDEPSPLATADPVTGQVPVYGFGSTAVDASRTQWSLFGEVLLPFTSTFDARLAGRYDHYSDFGGDFNPAIGLRWRPLDSVVVRGGWNTSFRAPSLAQVGAGTTLSSGSIPCAAGSEFRDNFCRGSSRDVGYLSQVFGNPNLEAETSTAWNLGAVWSPSDATSLSVDWWRFDQENLVDIADLDLFRRALTDPSLLYTPAGGARPRPPRAIGIVTQNGQVNGRIVEVFLELTNIGVQRTEGIDFGFDQRLGDDVFGGRLRGYAEGTWVRSFERSEQCSPATPQRRGYGPCVGGQRIIELVDEFRFPKWLANVGLVWEGRAVDARLWANYTDGYHDDDTRSGVPANRRVPSWTTLNASVNWDIDAVHSVGLTVRNLADRDPPLALGASSNVDTYNHDALGRFVTLNWISRF